jgi:hypothetical protein
MKKIIFILLLCIFIFINCSLQQIRTTDITQEQKDKCEQIDTMYKMWGGFSAGFAILSGAGGVSTIPFGDDKNAQIGIGITSLICGAFSAVSVWMQNSYAQDYTRDCNDK